MRDNVLWERTWRLEYPEIRLTTKEKGAIVATVEKNQSMQLDFNLKVDGRNFDEENLESNDKSIDEWIRQAKSFPEEVCNDGHHGGSIISDAPQAKSFPEEVCNDGHHGGSIISDAPQIIRSFHLNNQGGLIGFDESLDVV
ncbi:hypothetical protein RDABS01_028218 [Bienertia sinuspersici]